MSEYRYFLAKDEFGWDAHHFRVNRNDQVEARVPGTDQWFSMADIIEGVEDLINLYTPIGAEKVSITELVEGAQV